MKVKGELSTNILKLIKLQCSMLSQNNNPELPRKISVYTQLLTQIMNASFCLILNSHSISETLHLRRVQTSAHYFFFALYHMQYIFCGRIGYHFCSLTPEQLV